MSKLTKLAPVPRALLADTVIRRPDPRPEAERRGLLRVQVVAQSIHDTIGGRKIPGFSISPVILRRYSAPEAGTQAILGWGQKASGNRAAAAAARYGLRLIRAEDGFIRSIRRTDPPLSLLLDEHGMHFDPARPSIVDVELAKYRDAPLGDGQRVRIRKIIRTMIEAGVSKYNQNRDPASLPQSPYVLVLDQARNDSSVLASGGRTDDFLRMLEMARDDYPDHLIIVRSHPDHASGKTGGYFRPEHIAAHENVVEDKGHAHPCALLDGADHVYVYSSQAGFEALLRGKPVTCFGTPFYAWRGLTDDHGPQPGYERQQCRIDELAHAVLIDATRYFHPETGAPCEIETVIEHIALYRKMIANDPPRAVLHGFSMMKKKSGVPERFFPATEFVTDPRIIEDDPTLPVISWGKALEIGKGKLGDAPLPERPSRIIRVEDGFTRSRGLGAAFVDPLSWIVDPFGIHYDHETLSLIEKTLIEHEFTSEERNRAADYRMKLIGLGISKYNLARGAAWIRPEGRHVILVPGQVEDDMSIRYGSPAVRTNRGLLEAVRARNPDAYILYRPHPDIVEGFRPGNPMDDGNGIADEIDCNADIHDVLSKVDAVEVMTSLTGMEALMRGLPVTCHGLPFYAGWGLTNDLLPCPKRGRRLTLDELVYVAYIATPRFIGPVSGHPITAEQALDALAAAPVIPPKAPRALIARLAGHWLSRRNRAATTTRPLKDWPASARHRTSVT